MSPAIHPCLSCGACCAHFRVAFHWSETDACEGGITPSALTETLDPHRVVMRGTYGGAAVRCEQLRGDIGVDAHCSIYALRPSPCHALKPAWEDGTASPQCDKARVAHGMEPLTPQVWYALRGEAADALIIAAAGALQNQMHDQDNP
ncbi:YkgJ family cysteine cluster protein [Lysobacter gummosus]|uniref:YkgJ family cysteine cluster protein n=1 Tax=Lysobacter gummosus TaxID=262324 RepID=UPI00362B9568